MKPSGAPPALIFSWDRMHGLPLLLPAFLLISLAGHFGAFFLFRVVYPPQASLPKPPPPITVLDPSRPDHQALMRWAEAEDSSPAATQTGITARLLELPYRPSFSTIRTAPLTLSNSLGAIQYPPPRDPVSLIRSVESSQEQRPAPPAASPTGLRFSEPLSARASAITPPTLTHRSSQPLEPAEFLIGVSDRGEIRYIVLQRSSGNEALDADIEDYLSRTQLATSAEPIVWGKVAVRWGRDAYTTSAP